MFSQTMKPGAEGEKEKPNLFDKDIKDMVSAIIRRVHKTGSSQQQEEDDGSASIITLAGTNIGASMRGELLDEKYSAGALPSHPGMSIGDQPDALSTYVNSNFQSVNNSIMLGSTYNTNDPGVHMDITDSFEPEERKPYIHKKKGKKSKEKESFKSESSD